MREQPWKAHKITAHLGVHLDVCGSFDTPSLSGNKYFMNFIDELIRKILLAPGDAILI